MIKRNIRKVWYAAPGIGVLAVVLAFVSTPVFDDCGFTISGAKLVLTLSPGDTFVDGLARRNNFLQDHHRQYHLSIENTL
jgi:hypothetical protein